MLQVPTPVSVPAPGPREEWTDVARPVRAPVAPLLPMLFGLALLAAFVVAR